MWSVFAFKSLRYRFAQSFSALLGADLVLTMLSVPMVVTVHNAMQGAVSSSLQLFTVLLYLLYGWDLAIKGFIFHRALGVTMLQGTCLAFTMVLVSIFVGYAAGFGVQAQESVFDETDSSHATTDRSQGF